MEICIVIKLLIHNAHEKRISPIRLICLVTIEKRNAKYLAAWISNGYMTFHYLKAKLAAQNSGSINNLPETKKNPNQWRTKAFITHKGK